MKFCVNIIEYNGIFYTCGRPEVKLSKHCPCTHMAYLCIISIKIFSVLASINFRLIKQLSKSGQVKTWPTWLVAPSLLLSYICTVVASCPLISSGYYGLHYNFRYFSFSHTWHVPLLVKKSLKLYILISNSNAWHYSKPFTQWNDPVYNTILACTVG